ncbi:MAG TPA: TIGR03619 family F420-dependent LLM class oxidoreductase [Ilumatobacteraceae bacterium]|nr:TIGR03619 family F420-dependent LLM class oxidoreductase [Ilumatobacteraceae bacterium]
MRVGVDIPYLASSDEVTRYAQAMEELGFDHIGFSEHVCSTVDSQFPAPFFTFEEPWRETVTMATFVVAVTQRIEVNPAMMLVPLYHPVLAAKQLAEIAGLSEGRLRVAASIGWNHREAESLGVDPATRGARFEEQIDVMRRLWSEPVVDHAGRFFELRQVGISPRPAAPIPLWMGAGRIDQGGFPSRFAVARAARVADGFKFAAPTFLDRDQVARHVDELRVAVGAAGRDPDQFGIEVRMIAHETKPPEWSGVVRWAKALGVSHFGFANRIVGGSLDDQIEMCRQFLGETRESW